MSMTSEEMIEACLRHTMFSWSASGKVKPLPIARAEGVYMYTPEGRQILDFNSQLMSVNVGHAHPKVVAAMKRAAEGLIYVFPGAATEPRAKLGKRLAELCLACCQKVQQAVGLLHDMGNAQKIVAICEEIDRLESDADHVMRAAMSKLFRDEPDVRNLIKMKAIYEILETVTDRCEDVANIIEGIIVENA